MGNSESTGPGNGVEPAMEVDAEFLRACMEDMFDKDALRRSQMLDDGAGTSSAQIVKSDEISASLEDAEAVADAIACLAHPYDATARRMTVQRLTQDLAEKCREDDPFTTGIAQRVHFLKCMHVAMMKTWPRRAELRASAQRKGREKIKNKKDDILQRVLLHEPPKAAEPNRVNRRRRRKTSTSESPSKSIPGLSHSIRLGLSLFFTMLDSMEVDEACSPQQFADLMRKIVPLVSSFGTESGILKMLQEEEIDFGRSNEANLGTMSRLPSVGILNEVSDFLYRAAMGKKSVGRASGSKLDNDLFIFGSARLRKRPESARKEKEKEARLQININQNFVELPITAKERTEALEALFALGLSRAKLVDLLLCCKVLLEEAVLDSNPSKNLGIFASDKQDTPSTSPIHGLPSTCMNDDAGERSPDNKLAGFQKRGWRTVDEILTTGEIEMKTDKEESLSLKKNNNMEEIRSPRDRQHAKVGSSRGEGLEELRLKEKLIEFTEMDFAKLFKADVLGAKAGQVQVWSFGQNSYGELAQGDTITRKEPKQAMMPHEEQIKQIAAGNEHTVVLTKSGKVFAVGYNDNGQCGQGHNGRAAQMSLVEALNEKNIVQVHAYNGCEHTLCVSSQGELFSFGYNYRGQLGLGETHSISLPQLVPGFGTLGRRVTHVSCSYYHSAVSTDSGDLFTFGRNDFGQLGHGDTVDRKEPTKVEALALLDAVVSIACGQYHTAVALSNGSVYASGKNDYGQLGFKVPEPHRRMSQVKFFGGKQLQNSDKNHFLIKELRAGYYHTIALSTTGKLWVFGRNDYGQLGIGNSNQKVFGPRDIEEFDGETSKVFKIAAGCYHTLVVDDLQTLHVFGRNNHGQLGCGDASEKLSPFAMKSLSSGLRFVGIAAGFYHTIILMGSGSMEEARADDDDLDESIICPDSLKKMNSNLRQEREAILFQNTTLNPVEVAFLILNNLDRIALVHSRRQAQAQSAGFGRLKNYPPLDPEADRHMVEPNVTVPAVPPADLPFCIDSEPKALGLLVYLVRLCVEHSSSNLNLTTKRVFKWRYMKLALLRLIRSNVAQYLWSGEGPRIQQDICNYPSAGSPEVVRVLDEVHQLCLDLLEDPFPIEECETSQTLASEILITGLELFYPTQELQVQLLASLMTEEEEEDEDEERKEGDAKAPSPSKQHLVANSTGSNDSSLKFSPRSPLVKFYQNSHGAVFSKSLRRFFLTPLLRRLADDELVSGMVPYTAASSTSLSLVEKMIGSRDESGEASVSLLSNLLASLVRQVGSRVKTSTTIEENAAGFLNLLMSLQKHVLSWAASSEDPSELGDVKEFEGILDGMLASQGYDLHQQHQNLKPLRFPWGNPESTSTTTPWECLARYAEVLLRTCTEELATIESNEDLRRLEVSGSISARILPSFLLGMTLFAQKTFFCKRLLPKILEVLQIVDELARGLETIKDVERHYRVTSERFGASATPSKKKRVEEALALSHLPWLLQLEKTLAALGGKFSATLVSGLVEGESSILDSLQGSEELQGSYRVWRDCEMFDGGLESVVLQNLSLSSGAKASLNKEGGFLWDRVSCLEQKDSFSGNEKSLHGILAIFSSVKRQEILKNIVEGNLPAIEQLRKAFAAKNFGYNVTLIQGSRNGGEDATAMEAVEQSIFAALLKHTGSDLDMCLFVSNGTTGDARIPERIMQCWKATGEIRMHLVRLRSQLMANEEKAEKGTFQSFCDSYTRRAKFLLLFSSSARSIKARWSRVSSHADSASARWRILRIAVWTAIRWKKLAEESKRLNSESALAINMVVRFVKCPTDFSVPADLNAPPISPTKKLASPSKRKQQLFEQQHFNLGALFSLMAINCRRAILRLCGLNSFRKLLAIPTFPSVKADILRPLAPALRVSAVASSSALDTANEEDLRNHASELGAVGDIVMTHVHTSFRKLYVNLAEELTRALTENGESSTNERLLLLDAWAIPLGPGDVDLLYDTGLLKVLQRALRADRDSTQGNDVKDTNASASRSKQIGKVAWTLFRLLLSQVSDISQGDRRVSSLLDVLFEETEAALERMRPQGNGDQKMTEDAKPSTAAAILIKNPLRISCVSGGIKVEAREQRDDFENLSLSCWIMIEKQPGGLDRVVFSRGHDQLHLPIVTVRDIDGKLEAWTSENGCDSEKLTSKTSLMVNQWAHLVVSLERGKLRLFVNGELETQQTHEKAGSVRSSSQKGAFPVTIGEPHLDRMLGGIEGYVADMKLHYRALSPIHVHVLFNKGPPRLTSNLDRHCFQLVVLQQTLTESECGKKFLCKSRWLHLQSKLLLSGTARVQQAVLRLWRVLLPLNDPERVASHVVPALLTEREINESCAEGLINFMLKQIGLGMWQIRDTLSPVQEDDDEMEGYGQKKLVSKKGLTCNTNVSRMPQQAVRKKTESITSSESFAFASELVMLLRLLCKSKRWAKVVSACMESSMGDTGNKLFSPKAARGSPEFVSSDSMDALRSVGTLAVLGGHVESLRIGGQVAMTHRDITATVVALDDSTEESAIVVITPKNASSQRYSREEQDSVDSREASPIETVNESEQAADEANRSSKPLRIKPQDVVPISEFSSPFHNLSPKKRGKGAGPTQPSTKPSALEDAFYKLLHQLFAVPLERMRADGKAILLGQCKARTLKVLHEMLHTPDCNFDELLNHRSGEYGNISGALLCLATNETKNKRFITLEETEFRVEELRKRLHQMRGARREQSAAIVSPVWRKLAQREEGTLNEVEVLMYSEDEDDNLANGEHGDEEFDGKNDAENNHDDEDDFIIDNNGEMEDDPSSEGEEPSNGFGRTGLVHADEAGASSNAHLVNELVAMGFPEEWCAIALRIQGHDLIAASTWIVDNLDMLSSTPLSELLPDFPGSSTTSEMSFALEGDENSNLVEVLPSPTPRRKTTKRAAASKKRRRRLQRAKASLRKLEEPFQQLEETLADEIFSEDFFRTEACASYGYGYLCGALGLYDASKKGGFRNEDRLEAYRSEISFLSCEELEATCAEMEEDLAILYARSSLVQLLQRWREWAQDGMSFKKVFGSHFAEFGVFLRLILFRGPQLPPVVQQRFLPISELPSLALIATPRVSSAAAIEFAFPSAGRGFDAFGPLELGAATSEEDTSKKLREKEFEKEKTGKTTRSASAASGSILRIFVSAVEPCLRQMLRAIDGEELGESLVKQGLDDLQRAAKSEDHVDVAWGLRDPAGPDFIVMREPRAELDGWILGICQSEGLKCFTHEETASGLIQCLASPNLALKSICLQALVGIVRQSPSLSRGLPFRRLLNFCRRRVQQEVQANRTFHSRFVGCCSELLALAKASGEVICRMAEMEVIEDPISNRICKNKIVQHVCEQSSPSLTCCSDPAIRSTYLCSLCEELLCCKCVSMHDASHRLIKDPCCGNATSVQDDFEVDDVLGFVVSLGGTSFLEVSWSPISVRNQNAVAVILAANDIANTMSIDEARKTHWYRFENLRASTMYHVSFSLLNDAGEIIASRSLKSKTKDALKFVLDECKCGPNIEVSDRGLTACSTSLETWSTVLGSKGFSEGKHSWQIRVEESDSPYMFVGVATEEACLQTFLGGDEFGWGYIGDRAIYHKRNRLNVYGDRFGEADILTVTLDMDEGTLAFSRNGRDLGVAVDGLSGKLFPAFSFYTGSQRISLLRKSISASEPPSSAVELDEIESYFGERTLDKLWTLENVLHESGEGVKILSEVVSGSFESFKQWYPKQERLRIWTNLGLEVEVERPNLDQTVHTHLGVGRVLGKESSKDRLWLAMQEGCSAACYVRCNDDRVSVVEEQKIAEDDGDEEGEVGQLSNIRTLDDFQCILDDAGQSFDADIVAEVGSFCERKGENPFNISPKCIATDILPAILMRGKSLGFVQAAVRFCYLRSLNDLYADIMPFVGGLQCNDDSGEIPGNAGMTEVNWKLAIFPQKLSLLRSTIFWHRKRHLLEKLLHRTATVPKRAEDEYDYPEELPQLLLNRPKASYSKTLPDSESRLSFSLFGQTFDALHFLEPRVLRIAYSHPMDEGQSRTFKVKFEGEGVDDYGGPYREVFSEWSHELSETTLSPDGSADPKAQNVETPRNGFGNEDDGNDTDSMMKCVLPLFHPCPNRQHGVGANREKFVLRPDPGLPTRCPKDSAAHLLLEMINFCGQVLGIAMRTKAPLSLDIANLVWKPIVGETLNLEDLRDIDLSTAAFIEQLRSGSHLEAVCEDLRWNATLSDGTLLEFFPGGNCTKVQPQDIDSYIAALIQARLLESEQATAALREGLTSVVPGAILRLLTPEELERKLCGAPELDLELLKSVTDYDDDLKESDPHIQSFWRVLESFSNKERQLFLRFVWARSRLPPTKKDFPQHLKIQAPVAEGPRENPDSWLPKAHTCFFALSLPKYSSDEIMREKLKYAITNTTEMDADFNINQQENQHWNDLGSSS